MKNQLKISSKKMVNFEDIILLKGFGNYTTYQFVNGESVTVAKTIKMLELKLKSAQIFFRCHKSFLINTAHILDIDNEKIFMTNDINALVSRRKMKELNINFTSKQVVF